MFINRKVSVPVYARAAALAVPAIPTASEVPSAMAKDLRIA
jgi:hypothetical protein